VVEYQCQPTLKKLGEGLGIYIILDRSVIAETHKANVNRLEESVVFDCESSRICNLPPYHRDIFSTFFFSSDMMA
jgi:hypothetical protein